MTFGTLNSYQFYSWLIFTLIAAIISRRSLRNWRCHGFYRFFAFSTCALVLLLNIPYWHDDIFSPLQLMSWALLFVAGLLVVNGVYPLLSQNQRRDHDTYKENFAFENTGELIDTGIFGIIRHPMYCSLMLFTWGVCFKHLSVLSVCATVATTLTLWLTAKMEEQENLAFFGEQYHNYMQRTKNFLPYLW